MALHDLHKCEFAWPDDLEEDAGDDDDDEQMLRGNDGECPLTDSVIYRLLLNAVLF